MLRPRLSTAWSTTLRGMIPDGDFPVYLDIIDDAIAQHYRPEDVYAANLLGGVEEVVPAQVLVANAPLLTTAVGRGVGPGTVGAELVAQPPQP